MSGAGALSGADLRLPVEPYPGLRPFLDFEAALLFGRERQVREVIERLRQTQFVAVIGGSGSGKSSLVLAGAVPELRSFGIPGAGDFWIPMVCTPGTNVSQSDAAKRLNTPITRLAWKFASLLRSRGSPEKDAARLDEIASRLREEVGFSNLVDLYTDELDTPPGPDPKEARLLFVIDQFEELFHPTNKGVDDCGLLVERIIDHFFSPHPRCYVVLTMRSEHLNDCAGYLELPDAINKSSYLVRRLDEKELRNAIVEPAQRLLRLQQRSEKPDARLPAAVEFDTGVVERLLEDVRAISHDPDHLPLLQHVLARLWQAALARVKDRLDMPDLIGPADLAQAVNAAPPRPDTAIDPRINVLRASLEKWAEAVYQRRGGSVPRPDEERTQLDALLRRLAFKDPNTGMYTQQRLNVDDCARVLGAGRGRAELKALLDGGFLGNVDYLFWDDENPQRVTLKVSHESFIRGWQRFRQAIDAEAERFEEFADVLRKCERWKREEQAPEWLLQEGELRRWRDARLDAVLRDGVERAAWFRFLLLDRDGARLNRLEPDIDAFVGASAALQQAALDGERRRRRNKQRFAVAALLAVPPLLFWILVQGPVIDRTRLLFSAGNLANATPLRADRPAVGEAASSLQPLLQAAALIDRGRSGGDDIMAGINRWALGTFSGLPFVKPHADFVEQVAAGAEPVVNGNLRSLLQSAIWRGVPREPGDEATPMAATEPQARCRGADDTAVLRSGRLFTAHHSSNPKLTRHIFVPDLEPADTMVEVRSATLDEGACTTGQEIFKIPRHLDPDILIDANLRHVAYTTRAVDTQPKTVALYEIDWERTDDEGGRLVRRLPRAVLTGPDEGARVERSARSASERKPPVALVDTWRTPLGRSFTVDGQPWRIFSRTAVRPRDGSVDGQLEPLLPSSADSACGRLHSMLPEQPGFRILMFDEGAATRHCYAIARGRAPGAPANTDQVVVAVYDRPLSSSAGSRLALPAPIASLPSFSRVSAGAELEWFVGKHPGPLAGWVAMLGPDSDNKLRHVAAPWSTCALWRIGKDLLAEQAPVAAAAPATATGDEDACTGR